MADDKTNRGPQNRYRIVLREESEIAYWTNKLGVSREQLERAIRCVGNGAEAVAHYLKR